MSENQNQFWKDHHLQQQQQQQHSTNFPHHQSNQQFFQNNARNQFMPTNSVPLDQAQQPNFTVLADGTGKYLLKVYHSNNESADFQNQKYELFSNNSNNYLFSTQPQQGFQTDASFVNHEMQQQDVEGGTVTNMFINQLVGNWMPNANGNYTQFGERNDVLPTPGFSPSHVSQPNQAMHQHQAMPETVMGGRNDGKMHEADIFNNISPPSAAPFMQSPGNTFQQATIDTGNNKINSPNVVPKKPRIVAEVKPMRMSYSDVLIKNVAPNKQQQQQQQPGSVPVVNGAKGNSALSGAHNGTTAKPAKNAGAKNADRKVQNTLAAEEVVGGFGGKTTTRKSASEGKNSGGGAAKAAEVPTAPKTTGDKEEGEKEKKKGVSKCGKSQKQPAEEKLKGKQPTVKRAQQVPNAGRDQITRKPEASSEDEDDATADNDDDDDDYSIEEDSPRSSDIFYNIRKNDNKTGVSSSASKPKKSTGKINTVPTRGGLTKQDKSYNKRNQKSKRNAKHAMLIKMSEKWLEYTLMVLQWLWSLVADVVYLSLGLLWDKLTVGYTYVAQWCQMAYTECRSNSGLPRLRGWWQKMDGKFSSNSRWAFWRRFGNKKEPEPVKDYYKDGRLPSTAEEAMNSLLNCKGKDAYSILGVSPDCSQEQIRKHYKKIAVLVHPDKNKQPGAEEAFKVLQRSFELIGEPENRQTYDQSMAEALNAEKAWSEFNDLLTQLHTKISEAANTIRCSSCSLRHPRNPTGRPHYAARECNSCKIRHSAREGDIWAETTFFGLRWKYLALMEGNVYDITEWANCQKGPTALAHLVPNSHVVQYRIVLGGQSNSNQQQQQQQQSTQQPERDRFKKEPGTAAPGCEPDLDDFFNIYGGQTQQQQNSRRRHKKN